MNFRFPKTEKLKSKKTIGQLFSEGDSFIKFPLKLLYLSVGNKEITKAGFSVPKKNFKKAVDRNRIKRQMREAYRINKHLLKSNNGSTFALMFLYINKEKVSYESINKAMLALIKKISL
jgi:ribonuclease P protein component